ncbi:MAG: hemerythrin domain-containing protein [Candidatus Sericytochromatia bacterium]|nr:hemerythrin domain-containing protein [Candidatus Sericytochromatia bacterium]
MKRDPALQPLSREHLTALMLSYCLKHGRSSNPRYPWPADPREQVERVQQSWAQELRWHFEAEERFFFGPLLPTLPAPLQAMTRQLLAEHRAIETRIQAFDDLSDADLPDALSSLGHLLETHVRCEEREYFEQLQQAVPAEQLAKAGAALEAFYAEREPVRCLFTGTLRPAGS